jgi:hypothetical protein
MIRRLGIFAALALCVVVGVGTATAATTYTSAISGYEVAATSTQGTFAGSANGDLGGYWTATIHHTALSPNAVIDGGSFSLGTVLAGAPTLVTGTFTGGTITYLGSTGTCGNQSFAVDAFLGSVTAGAASGGSGTFTGTLTHYRTSIWGRCVTYAASVRGSISLTF